MTATTNQYEGSGGLYEVRSGLDGYRVVKWVGPSKPGWWFGVLFYLTEEVAHARARELAATVSPGRKQPPTT